MNIIPSQGIDEINLAIGRAAFFDFIKKVEKAQRPGATEKVLKRGNW